MYFRSEHLGGKSERIGETDLGRSYLAENGWELERDRIVTKNSGGAIKKKITTRQLFDGTDAIR